MQVLSILHTEKESLERGKGGRRPLWLYLIREGRGLEPILTKAERSLVCYLKEQKVCAVYSDINYEIFVMNLKYKICREPMRNNVFIYIIDWTAKLIN